MITVATNSSNDFTRLKHDPNVQIPLIRALWRIGGHQYHCIKYRMLMFVCHHSHGPPFSMSTKVDLISFNLIVVYLSILKGGALNDQYRT